MFQVWWYATNGERMNSPRLGNRRSSPFVTFQGTIEDESSLPFWGPGKADMKILAAALALTLATGTASAATLGDRLLDAKEAIDKADTAASVLDAARKIIAYREAIFAIPGVCEKGRKVDHDEPMNNKFNLLSCCSMLGEGGLGSLAGIAGTSLPWIRLPQGAKLTRIEQATLEEVRDQIEDRAGKEKVRDGLFSVGGAYVESCFPTFSRYLED